MATISDIKFKRSKTAGQKPAVASLKEGELAINLADIKLYTNTGDKVEDLTLRSGGKIDGHITQVGNYTQTGSTTISNELTVGMDITAKRNVKVSGQVVSSADIIANKNMQSVEWSGSRVRPSIEIITPTLNGDRLYTAARSITDAWGEWRSPAWNDLVVWTKAAKNYNHVYSGRSDVSATIWHHLLDARPTDNEWSIWAGSTPADKRLAINSRGVMVKSLAVGDAVMYSGLGEGSIAIGDNDTGFRNDGDGAFSIMANSRKMIGISSAGTHLVLIRKNTAIANTDNNDNAIGPGGNTALLQIDTSFDGNNSGGNGLTLIGYQDGNGLVQHYFRGRGAVNIDSQGGLRVAQAISAGGAITPGNYSNFDSRYLNINQNQTTTGQLILNGSAERLILDYAATSHAYVRGKRNGSAHWWMGCGSNGSTDIGFYNNITGAGLTISNVVSSSVQLQAPGLYLRDNASLVFAKAADNPRSMRIFHSGNAERGNRIEITDDSGYLTYFERHPTSGIRQAINGNLICLGSGNFDGPLIVSSTAGNAIQWGNAGACLANDGNLKGSRWKSFGGSDWAGDALSWVHSNNLSLGGGTMTGTLTMNANINMQEVENRGISLGNGSGTGIFQGRDGANNDYANIEIRSWYGVGFKNTQNSGEAYYNKNTIFMNLRNGQIQAYDYVTRSDRAYKENIKPIESASEKISKISGYTYNIKGSSEEIRSVGVIAQEVREVLPDAVSENEDGLLSVNYNAIIATLVQSNKEMQERIKALEKSRF
ncbi:TPA: tail fiber domain-containing protein [Enterobacter hormaechei]|nr:tail fiber domain-containing protein [Enterobacter hormaechei]EKT9367253.1 tail fiber domain-containing protein [Enterobacter hormaechei]EKW5513702.1 tail fiber domain-containing protein [Enterobacter hormaechei]EMA4426982.1 tail fiber domain-containing protein [Enterobacter hormaechei]EMD5672616.1 tail fiber domain-containing protein [Enterobacter hormaechei]